MFQDNPFRSSIPAPILAFLEAPKMVFGSSPEFNDRWVKTNLGSDVFELLSGQRISCCGTVMGTALGMLKYLTAFRSEVMHLKDTSWGADTSIHNKIIRGSLSSEVSLMDNFNIVATLGNELEDKLKYSSDGLLIGPDGLPVPVLHQALPQTYSRVVELLKKTDKWHAPSSRCS
jgi:hypothetical protein